MKITIKALGTSITPAIQATVEEKLQALERFLRPEHMVHVEVSVQDTKSRGQVFRAEVSISPDGWFADSEGETLYEAIDLVVPKIKLQVAKKKDKWVSLRRKLGGLKDRFFASGE